MPFFIEQHMEGQAKRNGAFCLIKVFKHFQNNKQRASFFVIILVDKWLEAKFPGSP